MQVSGPSEGEKVYTVSEVTASIKDVIETRFPYVWIVGEVSNCTFHSSGHTYFTLKDDLAQIDCALFRSQREFAVQLENGLKVFVQGRIGVYEKRGHYQVIVNSMLPVGKGALYIAFNELKARLEKEGLFDAACKRPLPRYPTRLGVVTSPTGAAIRDVIRVSRKIYPGIEIVVRPVRVQGEGAAEEVAQGIEDLNAAGGLDVIVVARGGGSIEDLWAFNEEVVARAIRASGIPVVSAVGHEIDYTIADFAADVRASTPSAAPLLVLADYADARTRVASLGGRAAAAIAGMIGRHQVFLSGLATRYGLRRIRDMIEAGSRGLDEAIESAQRLVCTRVENQRSRLIGLTERVESLNPLAVLKRGFAVCFRLETGERITSWRQISAGDHLRIVLSEGRAVCTVERSDKEAV